MLKRLRSVFASLHSHDVRYVVIGGIAAIAHGVPRATFDRIDVQTSTPGLSFRDAWKRKLVMSHEGQEFFVASREDLIASKRAAGRPRDLEDVRILELTRGQKG